MRVLFVCCVCTFDSIVSIQARALATYMKSIFTHVCLLSYRLPQSTVVYADPATASIYVEDVRKQSAGEDANIDDDDDDDDDSGNNND